MKKKVVSTLEILTNCDLLLDIELIECIISKDGLLEIYTVLNDKTPCVIYFDAVWDYRCSIEAACIERFSGFLRNTNHNSSILIVNNSEYVKYFTLQSSGTRPTAALVEYIVFDKVDCVISVLSENKPETKKIG